MEAKSAELKDAVGGMLSGDCKGILEARAKDYLNA